MTEDRFTELLAKKLAGEITPDELKEFMYLIGNDPVYAEVYNSMAGYWVKDDEDYVNSKMMFARISSRIKAEQGFEAETVEEEEEFKIPFYRKRFVWWAVAASITIFILFFLFYNDVPYLNAQGQAEELKVIRTQSRTKSSFTLQDGTVVTLNSSSEFRYPVAFNGKTREVYLIGEAFFKVAKDRHHPFIVHANKMNIKVLGTEFNVKSYPDDLSSEATLIEGAIELTILDRPSDRIILKPKEKLILKNDVDANIKNVAVKRLPSENNVLGAKYSLTGLTYLKSNDSTVVETSWMQNRFVFKNESFAELSHRIERWYGVQIRFSNERIKAYKFTGEFEREDIFQVLSALQMIEPFQYKQKRDGIYIY